MAALTGFTNVVLAGLCPKEATPFLFGGRMLALNKKSEGIRPIAVGVTLRRLASKCANTHSEARMAPLLGPRQLGVGIRGGVRQHFTPHAVTYKFWLQTMLWSNFILPVHLTVCTDLMCCCTSEIAYPSPSCTPSTPLNRSPKNCHR